MPEYKQIYNTARNELLRLLTARAIEERIDPTIGKGWHLDLVLQTLARELSKQAAVLTPFEAETAIVEANLRDDFPTSVAVVAEVMKDLRRLLSGQ